MRINTARLLIAVLTAIPAASHAAPEILASDLNHPWSIAFIPDGRVLVTERPGGMWIFTGSERVRALGMPNVYTQDVEGMMDVVVDAGFEQNHRFYFCYSRSDSTVSTTTTIVRATLNGNEVSIDRALFSQTSYPLGSSLLSGCRMAEDGAVLMVALGTRCRECSLAQDNGNTLGKIVRLNKEDGTVTQWTKGHRNPSGLTFDNGMLWEVEHGPKGGDELNLIQRGSNYGWPVAGFGINYDGTILHRGGPYIQGMIPPVREWTPAIAPSGLTFYRKDRILAWRNSVFIGSLLEKAIIRLDADHIPNNREERIPVGDRVRDVREHDGYLWVITDSDKGKLLKFGPEE